MNVSGEKGDGCIPFLTFFDEKEIRNSNDLTRNQGHWYDEWSKVDKNSRD